MKANVFKVRYDRDESGWWTAQVLEVPSAITQGRSIAEARRRIREALALALDDDDAARRAELRDLVQVPGGAKQALASARSQRARAKAVCERAEAATWKAALTLTRECGFSVRDAGEILGLSHQRVQQLVSREKTRTRARRPAKRPSLRS